MYDYYSKKLINSEGNSIKLLYHFSEVNVLHQFHKASATLLVLILMLQVQVVLKCANLKKKYRQFVSKI